MRRHSLVTFAKRAVLRALVKVRLGSTTVTRDGLRFMVFDDWIMGRVILRRSYERDWTDLVQGLIRPGDVCIDVGANFGYYTVLFASVVGRSGLVMSVEPNGDLLPVLRQNINLNNVEECVRLLPVAVGARSGRASLRNHTRSSGLGFVQGTSGRGEIEMTTLDELASQVLDRVSVLKMDIEGGEFAALAGAERILTGPHPPLVLCEFNSEAILRTGTSDPAQFWEVVKGYRYDVHVPGSRPITPDGDRFSSDGNYLLVPKYGRYSSRYASSRGLA